MISLEEIKAEIVRLLGIEGVVPVEVKVFEHPERRNELVLQVQDGKKVAVVTMLDEFRDVRSLRDYSQQFIEPAIWQFIGEFANAR